MPIPPRIARVEKRTESKPSLKLPSAYVCSPTTEHFCEARPNIYTVFYYSHSFLNQADRRLNNPPPPPPNQPEIVSKCDQFYFVQKNERCSAIPSRFDIILAKFAQAYDCVSIISEDADTTTTTTTTTTTLTTTTDNSVSTPQPIQPGMISNCAKFHWLAKGVTCSQIIRYNKISLADFARWNHSVNSDCSGMWAEVNVCVGLIGGTTAPPTSTTKPPPTTTTTTSAGNSI
ncbi:hypothetical protein PTNB29_10246 [Pyrenophora teres f. teres]|nr:hypothetical protein PTNB29_10246 [Pyrenophora teres f. teres]